jgi:hypothetical protein
MGLSANRPEELSRRALDSRINYKVIAEKDNGFFTMDGGTPLTNSIGQV